MFVQGFDNDMYIKLQSENIGKRIKKFGGKLYLEFGGKLFDDYHASRVLPGFQPDSKLRMLLKLKEKVEIVIVINSNHIENNKIRGDIGITYDTDVLRLVDSFRDYGFFVGSVVITHYSGQATVDAFKAKLLSFGIKVFIHYPIEGYPIDIPHIVSEEGYGKNEYIETQRPLVVITAPGPGSGKMATCLSQLYHEHKRGIKAGYAKFETFPIWNLPLSHPVNLAYEAATADLDDVNMIDHYHYEAHGEMAVNYNRDMEIFPVLNAMFEKIWGKSPYCSPTDMGVNMSGCCITDDEVCRKAAKDEIIRRLYATACANRKGNIGDEAIQKLKLIMNKAGATIEDRPVVGYAQRSSVETGNKPAVAIELPDGKLVRGKTTDLLGASAAALLNAVKALAGIDKEVKLIEPEIIEPIQKLKTGILGNKNPRLHTDEVLIALTISARESSAAKLAVEELKNLRGCEAHSTVILAQVDEDVFRKLGVNLTCEPLYDSKKLFHK